MLQLVDALDGDATRGADFLNLSGRMLSVLAKDGRGTSEGLQGKQAGFLGSESQFDTSLYAGLYVFENIRYAT